MHEVLDLIHLGRVFLLCCIPTDDLTSEHTSQVCQKSLVQNVLHARPQELLYSHCTACVDQGAFRLLEGEQVDGLTASVSASPLVSSVMLRKNE